MELAMLLTAGFLLGTFGCLALCLHLLWDANKRQTAFMQDELANLNLKMRDKVAEFEGIAKKASEANQSWAQAILDFDVKIKDLENRVAMLRMQR